MEAYLALVVGAMIGFGAAKAHAGLHGKWWLSIPAGALGGLAGRALWGDSLTASLQGSTMAAGAVAAAIGGALLSLLVTIARNVIASRF